MKKLISIIVSSALLLLFATSVSAVTPDELVGWWKFDEGADGTAHDSSNYVNDGTLNNSPTWTTDALIFDGLNNYVDVGDDSSLDFTGEFTVEAWVKGNVFQPGYYDLLVFRGYNKWAFGVFRGDRLMFGETAWNSLWSRHIYSDTIQLDTNHWYHVAVVYDTVNKTADFYLDGVPKGIGKQSTDEYGITNAGNVTIGYPHSVSFNGTIDDVKIWNKAVEYPYGVILEPEVDEEVYGKTDLVALYVDGDSENDDRMRWAVRYESCNAATDTRFGNVDGFDDDFEWDGMNFSAVIDTSTVNPGHYCFVLNPLDDNEKEVNVRETRWFYIADDDVFGDADYCPNTVFDTPDKDLGVNRWIWDKGDWIKGVIPGEKAKGPNKNFAMEQTHGCSCEQILGKLEDATGFDFEGHYKHGCSSSILEDWINGKYFIETVEVLATSIDGINTDNSLANGQEYLFEAFGTYRFANWGEYGIADAEWAYRNDGFKDNPLAPHGWTVGELTYPSVPGLDVLVNGGNVDWGDYSPVHEYNTTFVGDGTTTHFNIYDSAYGDNSGFITVDIFAKLY